MQRVKCRPHTWAMAPRPSGWEPGFRSVRTCFHMSVLSWGSAACRAVEEQEHSKALHRLQVPPCSSELTVKQKWQGACAVSAGVMGLVAPDSELGKIDIWLHPSNRSSFGQVVSFDLPFGCFLYLDPGFNGLIFAVTTPKPLLFA